MPRILAVLAIVLLSSILILACDGGHEEIDAFDSRALTPENTVVLNGMVVTDTPLPPVVQAINIRGETSEGKVGADGRFSVAVANYRPFMLRTIPRDEGKELFSFAASEEEDVYLTELTDLVLYVAVGLEPPLSDLFHAWTGQLTADEVQMAAATVNANLAPLFAKYGLDYKTYNVFRTAFHADGMGMDALLDAIHVQIDPHAETLSASIHLLDDDGNPLLKFDGNASVDNPAALPATTSQKKADDTR
jgi:hypothetical protein